MVEKRVDGGVEILLAPGVPPLPECPDELKSHLLQDLKESPVLELSWHHGEVLSETKEKSQS